jgi:eukaryotic-like serine/threonine-protein kinase
VADVRLKDHAETASNRIPSLPTTETRDIPPASGPTSRAGRYEVHAEIASGGMATVHIGRLVGPVGFARTVAIKRLHPPFAKDPEFVASFLDEARLAARIRHPNVVSTLDVVGTGGELFVVMEYVVGESLAQLMRLALAKGEQVPPAITATIMVGVLHGLHAAHEARDENGEPLRIVHRDVSPHNVLVGTDGAPHLIDFGVAKARGRSQTTREGQIKGKISYMPPEQLLGGAIDRRADVFAAAIVLWETLTGRRLFQGVDDGDVLARVLYQPVEPPSTYGPGITPAIDTVVLRGLARDLNKRYATAREMALAIEAAAPLAPPSQVGGWVESLAHDALTERSRLIEEVEREALFTDAGDSSLPPGLSAPIPVERRVPSFAASVPFGTTPAVPAAFGRVSLPPPTAPRIANTSFWRDTQEHTSTRALMALVRRSITGGPFGIRRNGARILVMLSALAAGLAVLGIARSRWHRGALADVRPVSSVAQTRPAASLSAPAPLLSTLTSPQPPQPPPPSPPDYNPGFRPAPIRRPTPAAPVPPAPTWIRLGREAPSPAPTHTVRQEPPPPPTTLPTSAPSAAPSSASCDPPFWYDAEGNKRYYRNCTGP